MGTVTAPWTQFHRNHRPAGWHCWSVLPSRGEPTSSAKGTLLQYDLADLHVHTYCSDGLRTPTEAVEQARDAGVRILGLTDHDSVAGIPEAMEAGKALGVKLVPGTELSAFACGREIHLLAYFFDWRSQTLVDYLAMFQKRRYARGVAIVERLNDLGIQLSIGDVMAEAEGGLVGRPHVAAALVACGAVASKEEAFDRYIGDRKPAVVAKPNASAKDVICMVHRIGGVAVLAHPGASCPEALVTELIGVGLDGIEVYHPAHLPPQIDHYSRLVERFGLVASGGSDSHGEPTGSVIGSCGIGCEAVETLEARAAAHASS